MGRSCCVESVVKGIPQVRHFRSTGKAAVSVISKLSAVVTEESGSDAVDGVDAAGAVVTEEEEDDDDDASEAGGDDMQSIDEAGAVDIQMTDFLNDDRDFESGSDSEVGVAGDKEDPEFTDPNFGETRADEK